MILIFEFFSLIFSLKPIYLVSGFGDFPIYSRIDNQTLYPECPPEIYHKNVKISDPRFSSAYPECVAKLLRVQFNNTTKKVEQLPGIRMYNQPFNDISPYFDTFGTIIDKIKDLGYQINVNIFGVGYNYFLHPVTSYPVYNELKSKIEQDYMQTREKSIFISFDQGTSFTSIFLSNFSQSEWVKKYIDSVIFIAPTFAGFPSIPESISHAIPQFKTNDELRKSITRMPGLHIRIPNYAIFEKTSKTQTSKFLKEIGNFDKESEIIFKSEAEKYLREPVPEPPIPSLLVYNDIPVKTVSSFNFRYKDDKFVSSTVSQYLCTKWKTIQCANLKDSTNHSEIPKTIKTANFITNYLINRNEKSISKHLLASVPNVEIKQATGQYATYEYVNSHLVSPLKFSVEAPQGVNTKPLSNAFDDNLTTYYISSIPNSESYNTTIMINFTEKVSLEAIIYDSSYTTKSSRRIFQGFPTLIYVYTSTDDQPFSLHTIFKGDPIGIFIKYQYVFPRVVRCDKIKLEFAKVTLQTISGSGNNLVISNICFIQYFSNNFNGCAPVIYESSFYASYGYVNKRKVQKSDFTFSGTEGQENYPISNLFDDDDTTLYIPSIENSATFNNSISVAFKKTVNLEAFLLSTSLNINGGTLQGFPNVITVYTSTGNQQLSFKASFKGNPFDAWKRVQYVFNEPVLCDNLKLEFYDLYDSKSPVIAGLLFVEKQETLKITSPTGNYNYNGYVSSHVIHPSEFTYSGPEGNENYPLHNIFDYDSQTYYLSNVYNNDTFYCPITINFLKTVELEAFLIDTTYITIISGERGFVGTPIVLYFYASLGNEPLQLKAMFTGIPVYPMTRLQFAFKESIKCDTIRIDFVEITSQRNKAKTKQLSFSELLLLKKMEIEPTLFTGVANKFDNNDYVMSHRIDPMNFTYDAPEGESNYPIENAFDDNPKTFYVSNIVNNNYSYTTMIVNFDEVIDLEALIIDPSYTTSGTYYSYQGFPLGIMVSKSIEEEEFSLNTIFIGDPVYPWDRIQFVFPFVIRCDKLKLEFVEVSNENLFVKRKSLTIGQLYFIRSELPAPTRSPQPIPISEVCEIGKTHCNYEGNEQNKVVVIIKSNFSSIASDDDGGALHIVNAGISCETMIISGCQSKQGGGGGLFIDNNIDMPNMIYIKTVNFTNCAANYGGAIFVHSSTTTGKVEINKCFFTSCQSISSKSSSSDSFTGGSALFMSSKNSLIADCCFTKNTGESQLKIYNSFESSSKNRKSLLAFLPKTINMISFCRFETERNSKCSMYYFGGLDGVGCYVKNSIFTGSLSYNNYHISGQSLSEKSPKLVIELCKFSHDQRRSFNNDGDNDYMSVIFQKQVFNYNEEEESNDDDGSSFNYTIIIVSVAVILIIVIILFVIKKSVEIAHVGNAALSASNAQNS